MTRSVSDFRVNTHTQRTLKYLMVISSFHLVVLGMYQEGCSCKVIKYNAYKPLVASLHKWTQIGTSRHK